MPKLRSFRMAKIFMLATTLTLILANASIVAGISWYSPDTFLSISGFLAGMTGLVWPLDSDPSAAPSEAAE
ncbi:hypothetical protein [Ruegeria lacuscaerulensis]|uniref:hypothetical protein n=1 Tax=Ruegeria lacuscaerulensis TaxID=55218 RepID=UPI00147DF99E|nr:hypothetical protein [Ruegeria lacuscaerulensis]